MAWNLIYRTPLSGKGLVGGRPIIFLLDRRTGAIDLASFALSIYSSKLKALIFSFHFSAFFFFFSFWFLPLPSLPFASFLSGRLGGSTSVGKASNLVDFVPLSPTFHPLYLYSSSRYPPKLIPALHSGTFPLCLFSFRFISFLSPPTAWNPGYYFSILEATL